MPLVDFVPANLYCHETVPDPLQFSMSVQIVWQAFLQDAQHIFPATIVKNNTITLITQLADLLCGRTESNSPHIWVLS